MLRLTLVTVVIYIVDHLQHVVGEGSPRQNPTLATCELGQPTAVVSLQTYGRIPVACPQGSSLRQSRLAEPPEADRPIFSKDDLRAPPVVLAQVVPGARFELTPASAAVNVVQLPSTPQSLFFLCQSDGSGVRLYCFIRLDIPGSPPLGPNACAVRNTEIKFTVGASGSTVEFACGHNGTLHPDKAEKVFDHTCTKELNLHTVASGAVCERRLAKRTVAVKFPQLPPTRQKLCYLCVLENNGQKPGNECRVFIDVAGSDEDDTSAAVSITTRSASALAITVAAGFFLL